MPDPTESIRRQRLAEINAEPGSREALAAEYGQVWDITPACKLHDSMTGYKSFVVPL